MEEQTTPIPRGEWERGTATLLRFVRILCKFARRYDYVRLLAAATGNPAMGNAINALITACDIFESVDKNWGSHGELEEEEEV